MKTAYDIIIKPVITEQSMEDVYKRQFRTHIRTLRALWCAPPVMVQPNS